MVNRQVATQSKRSLLGPFKALLGPLKAARQAMLNRVKVKYKECTVLVQYKWDNGDVIIKDVNFIDNDLDSFLDYLEEPTEGRLAFKAKVREAAEQQALRIIREGKKDENCKEP